jgi:hypothetical protein
MKNLIVDFSAVLSVIFAVGAGIPYITSILSGKTKPHQMTWLVFSIMNGIVFLSQYLKGARASVLISLVFFVFTIIDFLLSLRYGVRNTSRWDSLLLGFSLLTIVIWALTKNPSVAIWLTVLIDIFATSMMILKIRVRPGSEAILPWAMGTTAYMFTITALVDKPFGVLYVRPVYGFLSDVAVIAAVLFYSSSKRKKTPLSETPPATH